MTDDTIKAKDEARARELIDREYGKDHPAARSPFAVTFRTTTHEHQVRELTKAFQEVRAERDAELRRAMAVVEAALSWNAAASETFAECVFRACVSQGFITPTGERK